MAANMEALVALTAALERLDRFERKLDEMAKHIMVLDLQLVAISKRLDDATVSISLEDSGSRYRDRYKAHPDD